MSLYNPNTLQEEYGIQEAFSSYLGMAVPPETNESFLRRQRRADSAIYLHIKELKEKQELQPPLNIRPTDYAKDHASSLRLFFSSKKVLSELKNIEFEDNLMRQQVQWMKHQKDQGSDPFYINESNPDISFYGQHKLPTSAKMNILDYWEPPKKRTIYDVYYDYVKRYNHYIPHSKFDYSANRRTVLYIIPNEHTRALVSDGSLKTMISSIANKIQANGQLEDETDKQFPRDNI